MVNGPDLGPSLEDAAALRWVEENPPDGIRLPPHVQVREAAHAFRREGTPKKEGKATDPKDKVAARPLVGLVAVDGSFAWTWREPPPVRVRQALTALCPDVSHLASAETPVRLRVGTAVPTHRRDPDASLFSRPGLDVDVASTGRTEKLVRAHAAARTAPTAASDAYKTSEGPLSARSVPEGRAPARYIAEEAESPDAPWDTVLTACRTGHEADDLTDQRAAPTPLPRLAAGVPTAQHEGQRTGPQQRARVGRARVPHRSVLRGLRGRGAVDLPGSEVGVEHPV